MARNSSAVGSSTRSMILYSMASYGLKYRVRAVSFSIFSMECPVWIESIFICRLQEAVSPASLCMLQTLNARSHWWILLMMAQESRGSTIVLPLAQQKHACGIRACAHHVLLGTAQLLPVDVHIRGLHLGESLHGLPEHDGCRR